jgi:hypothetical protein
VPEGHAVGAAIFAWCIHMAVLLRRTNDFPVSLPAAAPPTVRELRCGSGVGYATDALLRISLIRISLILEPAHDAKKIRNIEGR